MFWLEAFVRRVFNVERQSDGEGRILRKWRYFEKSLSILHVGEWPVHALFVAGERSYKTFFLFL